MSNDVNGFWWFVGAAFGAGIMGLGGSLIPDFPIRDEGIGFLIVCAGLFFFRRRILAYIIKRDKKEDL